MVHRERHRHHRTRLHLPESRGELHKTALMATRTHAKETSGHGSSSERFAETAERDSRSAAVRGASLQEVKEVEEEKGEWGPEQRRRATFSPSSDSSSLKYLQLSTR